MSGNPNDKAGFPVVFGNGDESFFHRLHALSFNQILLLCDTNTHSYCYPLVESCLNPESVQVLIVEAGEKSKTTDRLIDIWKVLAESRFTRNSCVLNLGGGMICDLGGMAAATFHRGIPFINLPTTLLAMVDAASGGKTGIDFHGMKNILGVFAKPRDIMVYTGFLNTLPERELRSGFVEMLKHALLHSREMWEELKLLSPAAIIDHPDRIARSAGVKMGFVNDDPFDLGRRQALNLGHTAGHAIEAWSLKHFSEPLLHGEAIALGMMTEISLSVKFAGLDEAFALEAADVFKPFATRPIPGLADIPEIMNMAGFDKKNKGNKLLFSLLKDCGKPVCQVSVPENALAHALEKAIQGL